MRDTGSSSKDYGVRYHYTVRLVMCEFREVYNDDTDTIKK